MWNKRNLLVRTRLWCLRTSQRTTSIWSRTRYKASTDAVKCYGCKTKFVETTQQPNSGLLCSAGSLPKKKWNPLPSLESTKKTWSRWERRLRRGSKMVRRYPVQEAVIISFPTQLHKLDTNCTVRMTHLWISMTLKFQLKLILGNCTIVLHLVHVQLIVTAWFGEPSWWGARWCRCPIHDEF